MRSILIGTVFLCTLAEAVSAAPVRWAPDKVLLSVDRARWECNENRCIDTRSGAYTQSHCGYGGCRPMSGIVGYADPRTSPQRPRYRGYGYDDRGGYYPPPPRYDDED